MPRTARASAANLCYHVLNRGNNRASVFHEDGDFNAFVDLLGIIGVGSSFQGNDEPTPIAPLQSPGLMCQRISPSFPRCCSRSRILPMGIPWLYR